MRRVDIFFSRHQVLIAIFLFGLAFVPRALNLTAYVAADEAKWILRSAHFLTALLKGDFGAAASQVATPEVGVLAPAVTTMWTGAVGLLAKYLADGAPLALLDYLDALPYTHSERVTLDFYPWLRFPTVLIASIFVVAFYVILRKLLTSRRIALTASILLALDPFFLNHSRVIHHDGLVAVFMTLSLMSLLVYLQGKGGRWWLTLSGIAMGLGMLTKPIALFLVIFAGLMGVWQTYSERDPTRRLIEASVGRNLYRRLLKWLVVWSAISVLTCVVAWPALWVDPVGTLYRLAQTSLTAATGDHRYALIPTLVPNRVPDLGFLFYPVNWLLRWGILPTLGLAAVPFTWRGTDSAGDKSFLVWLALFSSLLMLALMPLGTRDIRYYLPAWPALMTLAAFGLARLSGLMRPLVVVFLSVVLLIPYYPYYVTYYHPLIGGPYLAPSLVKVGGGEGMDQVAAYLNAQPDIAEKTIASTMSESFVPYFSGRVVEHHDRDAYAEVVVNYIRQIQNGNPSDEYLAYFAARAPQHTVRLDGIEYAHIYFEPSPRPVRNVSFGDTVLVAQTLDARFAQPGQKHILTLLWRAPSALRASRVRLQVRDLAGRVWIESEGPLLSPEGPSAVEGHYAVTAREDMPRGDYQLWATVGPDENWTLIGTLPIYRFAPPEAMPNSVDANFGGLIALRGFDVSERIASPGETVTLTLYWQALKSVPRSYTTFVHLLDPSGNRVAQSDVVPGNGQWPTDTWQAGEWVTDRIPLAVPATLPIGAYRLLVGWYDWETGERLLLTGEETGNALNVVDLSIGQR